MRELISLLTLLGVGALLRIAITNKHKLRKMAETFESIKAKQEATLAALTSISGSVTGIGTDVTDLKKQIADLQAGGTITQAQLDELGAAADSISQKVAEIGATTADLDAQTPGGTGNDDDDDDEEEPGT